MNNRQRKILIAVAALIGLMLLYPPYQLHTGAGMGYSWLFSPPEYGYSFHAVIHASQLLVQWIAVLLIGGVAYIYPRLPSDRPLLKLGAGLLTGGAVGNLIDRIRLGQVVDFFDFRIWPIFNVADIGIVCGIACLAYVLLFMPEPPNSGEEGKNG